MSRPSVIIRAQVQTCPIFYTGVGRTVKQTLIEIQRLYEEKAGAGFPQEPTADELAQIIMRRIPASAALQRRYWRGMGEFIGQALQGVVIDPREWTPPD
jgi:hypothetical protein